MANFKRILTLIAALAGAVMMYHAGANMGGSDDSAADDPSVVDAKSAIEAGDWSRAIELLNKAAQAYPDSADVQNFLGYAYRKSGNLDAAFAHYDKALEIDPQHKHAHEYIGEAYLIAGDVSRAQQHLDALQKICSPIPCEEVKQLRRAIEAFKKNHH